MDDTFLFDADAPLADTILHKAMQNECERLSSPLRLKERIAIHAFLLGGYIHQKSFQPAKNIVPEKREGGSKQDPKDVEDDPC